MEKKTRKSFIWLAILLLGTIWILAQRNKQIPYNSINGLVFGTVYNITYQYDGNLKAEIDAELKKFDGSLSPFNDTSVITRVNRNEEIVTDTFFQTCFNRSMEISAETRGAFDITVAPLANAWGFGFKKGAFPDSIMIDSLLQITGYQKVKLENGKVIARDQHAGLAGKTSHGNFYQLSLPKGIHANNGCSLRARARSMGGKSSNGKLELVKE